MYLVTYLKNISTILQWRFWPGRKQTRYLASCYKVWESDGIWPNGSVWRRRKILVLVHWKSNSRIRWRVPLDYFMSSAFFEFSIWFTWVSGGVWWWFLWYMFVSMTLLLMHTVAHSNRLSFRPKTNNQPIKKFLGLVVSWVKVVKNCNILTCKVNFLCQKWSESF